MSLTREQVSHIAHLARLELTEAELETYTRQLSDILAYVDRLQAVYTDNIPPTTQVTGLHDVTRLDEIVTTDPAMRQQIINNIPTKEGDYIKVKTVFE